MSVAKGQFSTIEVLVAMPMTRWEFKIVPCPAGGKASATCLKMLFMRFADGPLSLLQHFAVHYKFVLIIYYKYEQYLNFHILRFEI